MWIVFNISDAVHIKIYYVFKITLCTNFFPLRDHINKASCDAFQTEILICYSNVPGVP